MLEAVLAAAPVADGSRVTIFAPTNEAFEAAAELFGGALPDDADVIADVRPPPLAPFRVVPCCAAHAALCMLCLVSNK